MAGVVHANERPAGRPGNEIGVPRVADEDHRGNGWASRWAASSSRS